MDENQATRPDETVEALLQEVLGKSEARSDTAETAKLPIDPALLSKLPELLSAISPSQKGGGNDKRLALLCALKPYLSPKRCETIDYITKISRLSDTVKHIKL